MRLQKLSKDFEILCDHLSLKSPAYLSVERQCTLIVILVTQWGLSDGSLIFTYFTISYNT